MTTRARGDMERKSWQRPVLPASARKRPTADFRPNVTSMNANPRQGLLETIGEGSPQWLIKLCGRRQTSVNHVKHASDPC